MSETVHTVHCFKFINRTRYSSEDIIALVNLMAKEAVRLGASPDAPFELSSYYARDKADGVLYDIGDYNPRVVWEDLDTWDHSTSSRSRRRIGHLVKDPGHSLSTFWRLNIVPPERAYDNPMEALSDTTGKAHPEIVVQLVRALHQVIRPTGPMYQSWQSMEAYRAAIMDTVTKRYPGIGVMPTRESSASSKSKKNRVAMARVRSSMGAVVSDLHNSSRAMADAITRFGAALDAAANAGAKVPLNMTEFRSIHDALTSLTARSEAMHKSLEV